MLLSFCFRAGGRHYSESEFDLVVPVLTSPNQWLSDIEGLIAMSRAVRNRSELLRQKSNILREEIALIKDRFLNERGRSRRELARNVEFLRGDQPSGGEMNRRD